MSSPNPEHNPGPAPEPHPELNVLSSDSIERFRQTQNLQLASATQDLEFFDVNGRRARRDEAFSTFDDQAEAYLQANGIPETHPDYATLRDILRRFSIDNISNTYWVAQQHNEDGSVTPSGQEQWQTMFAQAQSIYNPETPPEPPTPPGPEQFEAIRTPELDAAREALAAARREYMRIDAGRARRSLPGLRREFRHANLEAARQAYEAARNELLRVEGGTFTQAGANPEVMYELSHAACMNEIAAMAQESRAQRLLATGQYIVNPENGQIVEKEAKTPVGKMLHKFYNWWARSSGRLLGLGTGKKLVAGSAVGYAAGATGAIIGGAIGSIFGPAGVVIAGVIGNRFAKRHAMHQIQRRGGAAELFADRDNTRLRGRLEAAAYQGGGTHGLTEAVETQTRREIRRNRINTAMFMGSAALASVLVGTHALPSPRHFDGYRVDDPSQYPPYDPPEGGYPDHPDGGGTDRGAGVRGGLDSQIGGGLPDMQDASPGMHSAEVVSGPGFTVESGSGIIREIGQYDGNLTPRQSYEIYQQLHREFGRNIIDVDKIPGIRNDTYLVGSDVRLRAPGSAHWAPGVKARLDELIAATKS